MKAQNAVDIVTTLGPATTNPALIEALLKAGASVVCVRDGVGTLADHTFFIDTARQVASRLGRRVVIMQELPDLAFSATGDDFILDSDASIVNDQTVAAIRALLTREVDYLTQPRTRTARDVADLRSLLAAEGETRKIVATVSCQSAVQNLDEIIAAADGLLLPSGAWGGRLPAERLPFIKQAIIKRCAVARLPCIVVTDSLISPEKPQPSTAPAAVATLAHAVLSGAGAILLSEETTVGPDPVAMVKLVQRVLTEAGQHNQSGLVARLT